MRSSCSYFLIRYDDCLNIVPDGYSASDVEYVWTHGNGKSIKMASDMTLSQFDLVGIPANNETAKRPGGKEINLSP